MADPYASTGSCVLTRAELAVLAAWAGLAEVNLSIELSLPALHGDEDEVARAGTASLIARGLVALEPDRVIVDPLVAAAGLAVAAPFHSILLGARTSSAASSARIVESGGARLVLSPEAVGNVRVFMVDATSPLEEMVVDLAARLRDDGGVHEARYVVEVVAAARLDVVVDDTDAFDAALRSALAVSG